MSAPRPSRPASEGAGPIVEVRGLGFAYGPRKILEDLTFQVREGEILGVAGPNGSGKTTLVRVLSRVLPAHGGEIRIAGEALEAIGHKQLARALAVVPQETHLAFPFRVFEVVLMGRAPFRGSFSFDSGEDLRIAREALDLAGIGHLEGRVFGELSGGEKQMVVLARALAQRPRILLLDEPTAFLDIRHQVEVYDLIRRLNRDRGLTVVTTLHDLNLASLYCDRLMLMKAGRIFALDTPETVITYPNVREVYEVEVYVDLNTVTGKVNILPLGRSALGRGAKEGGEGAGGPAAGRGEAP